MNKQIAADLPVTVIPSLDKMGKGTMYRDFDFDPTFFHSSRSAHGTGIYSEKAKRQPYSNHSWTYAAINRIVGPTSALPKILVHRKDSSRTKEDDPILDLFDEPNPYLSGTELWELTLMYLLLPTMSTPGGQCFWYLENGRDKELFNSRRDWPIAIWPYSDRVIKPKKKRNYKRGGTEELVGWKMEVNGQTIMEFGLNEILRFRFLNPYDLSKGLSPYSAAMTPVTQDLLADEFNTRFFANDAAIGGILQTDNESITMEQLRQYSEYFDENYSGPGHAGRTAALAHGLKYDRFMLGNRDMQYMEQRKDNRYRVQAVFGVNEEEIGIYEKGMNRSTAEQADRSVWQKTRLPLDQKICRTLNIKLFKHLYRGEWKLKSDVSGIESLRADYSDRIKSAVLLIKSGMVPPAEAFRELQIPIDSDRYPWLEKSFVPMNLIDAKLLADGYVAPTTGQPKPEKELLNRLTTLVRKKHVGDEDISNICNLAAQADREERDRMWEDYVRTVLDPGEKSLIIKLKRHVTGLRNEMLDKVDSWTSGHKSFGNIRTAKMEPALFLFDLEGANKDMLRLYKPEAREQMRRELKRLQSKYGDKIQWNITDETVGKFVDKRKKWLKEAEGLTFDKAKSEVVETIKQGFDDNWTPQEFSKHLKENISQRMNGIGAGWTKVIARTEVGSITSMSRFETFVESKIEKHEWLSAKDELVRPTHQLTDGQVVRVGDTFKNGLKYPLDSEGSAEEIINCFHPDTIVSGSFVAGSKTRYSGPVVVIITIDGNRLTVTPNHPIFTVSGWIPACCLTKSNYVITYRGKKQRPVSFPSAEDNKQRPASIKQTFDFLVRQTGGFDRMVAQTDFHGDGKFCQGNVNVVSLNGELLADSNTKTTQFIGNDVFSVADFSVHSQSLETPLSLGCGVAPSCSPSTATLADDSLAVELHGRPFHALRFGPASNVDAHASEIIKQSYSIDANFMRQLFHGFSGNIAISKIVEIRNMDFCGHVYDLQSNGGWLLCDNIICGNCRCDTIPRLA